ncbi:MAG TPA: hypothetical protein VHI52_22655 [Verrucomicrobiae bacterium]|nr:hypothetical protein [Verrucomicrobiae bacterium]
MTNLTWIYWLLLAVVAFMLFWPNDKWPKDRWPKDKWPPGTDDDGGRYA